MDSLHQESVGPQHPSIIKVSDGHWPRRKASHQQIPPWTRLRWRAAYWWHARWPAPDFKSPGWAAVSMALLLVAALASMASARVITRQPGEPLPDKAQHTPTAVAANHPTSPGLSPVGPAVAAHAYAAASVIYVVQPGDTLYRIANRYGTTYQALDQVNQLNNTISVGQVLVIPPSSYDPSVPHAGRFTDETMANTSLNRACAQFSFQQGKDAHLGSMPGVYALYDVTGGQIAAWSAPEGVLTSGWINDLSLIFESVYVQVIFYPRHGNGDFFFMDMVNPAPGVSQGWLTRGMCHSLEIQYPAGH